jgi:hypothetical protein
MDGGSGLREGADHRTVTTRATSASVVLLLTLLDASAAERATPDLAGGFDKTVRPFVANYCVRCHSRPDPVADFDLTVYERLDAVTRDHARWSQIRERLSAKEMPPADAEIQPSDEERRQVVTWIEAMRREEARKNAADPGLVLARRLSNAEYDYSIRDLTGVDIRPAREFPVDPANPAGFDNSGESLAMSPALMTKYLEAARSVADHLVLKPEGLAFAPHPMRVETDRDKYCVTQILDFYARQATDYGDYFRTAWRYKHRAALGRPKVTLDQLAAEERVSAKYLKTVWHSLEGAPEGVGPMATLQALWHGLPAPRGEPTDLVAAGCERMRDFVVRLRKKTAPRHAAIAGKGLRSDAQPFVMWRNWQYATHRTRYDPTVLQVEGETAGTDPDLHVPAGERARYEAAFARFAAVFPDAFYLSERGRKFPEVSREKGQHLSAGFLNAMGYFRDDLPLYELVLDAKGQKELDALWRDLDFVASATLRTFVQYMNDTEVRPADKSQGRPADAEMASDAGIAQVMEFQLAKARAAGNETAVQAVQDHFRSVSASIRWAETAHKEAEPRHLAALQDFAARAYRRPLSPDERADLVAFYRSLRETAELDHEQAMRDSVASVLMSPDFCYRIDLVPPGGGIRALSDHALASRLSYFLWSSLPDAELLAHAARGDLRRPAILARQARRMLKDARVRGLATEFGGQWLDFRRFEQHNAVDRETFQTFDHDLRQAMFEEPVRFLLDVFRENRSVLELLYGTHTFVNPALARHYGIPGVTGTSNQWVRVADADRYGRGGLLPMSVFLTKNAPGLRTSPVKRGYWVVKQVLGEHIPPPPAVVPELPREEAKMDLPLREMLARHREDKTCASCHARFDSYGLAFEGYGPIGERRSRDLAGRPVDDSATFPGGGAGRGLAGLRAHVRERRQDDFVDTLSRRLLVYSLGRSVALGDEVLIESMRTRLAKDGYRFASLVESIVTSPQFLTRRSVAEAKVAER